MTFYQLIIIADNGVDSISIYAEGNLKEASHGNLMGNWNKFY